MLRKQEKGAVAPGFILVQQPLFVRRFSRDTKLPAGSTRDASGGEELGGGWKNYLLEKSEMRSTMRIRSSRVVFSLGR